MREVHILNLGAGVQSTTVYLMHKFDVAIFADTGEEPEAVYQHLEWLKGTGRTPILVRSKGRRLGEDLKYGTNSTGGRFASIPAFTKHPESGQVGLSRRQCSKEYKLEVIERAIRRDVLGLQPRRTIPKDVTVHQYFGISLDEAGRAARIRNAPRHKQFVLHFPLVESCWTRTDCLNWLADKVPHQVPRSACVFCPYRSDATWLDIKKNPADWARAVEIDEALRVSGGVFKRGMTGDLYVHRSCKPLVQIEFNPNPSPREQQLALGMAQECLGVCGI